MKGANVRAQAATTLAQVISDGKSLNQILSPALAQVAPQDRALLQELCYGTLRFAPLLEALLKQLLAKPLKPKDSDINALLLLGLYQLYAMRLPGHAAVNTTVAATSTLGKGWAKKLCNAVLRRYQREASDLTAQLDPAASAAHPQWLYKALGQQWPDHRQHIIDANNNRPPMTLRVNKRLLTQEQGLAILREAGIHCSAGKISDSAICLEQAVDVNAIPGFADSQFSVQDEAAQLAAHLLAACPGERILDACAAPGGKTCHILERQPELSELVALDNNPERLKRIEENLSRLNLTATLLCADASAPPNTLATGSFDRILLDAPCSATGVIRRHPDIKTLRKGPDIDKFALTQQQLLQGVWPLLKSGGHLLYVTCSILSEENDTVIEQWLTDQQDAQSVNINADWGQATRYGQQLLPDNHGADGLYYALLTKTGKNP